MSRFLLGIGLLLVWLTGCGTLQVGVEANSTRQPAPTATRTPTQPAATASPPAATPSPSLQRISFAPGATSFTFTTELVGDAPRSYIIQVIGGQTMTVKTNPAVTIKVVDTQNRAVPPAAAVGEWKGTVPQTADYIIILSGSGLVNVTIDIPPPR